MACAFQDIAHDDDDGEDDDDGDDDDGDNDDFFGPCSKSNHIYKHNLERG